MKKDSGWSPEGCFAIIVDDRPGYKPPVSECVTCALWKEDKSLLRGGRCSSVTALPCMAENRPSSNDVLFKRIHPEKEKAKVEEIDNLPHEKPAHERAAFYCTKCGIGFHHKPKHDIFPLCSLHQDEMDYLGTPVSMSFAALHCQDIAPGQSGDGRVRYKDGF